MTEAFDRITPFQLESGRLRGRLVRLGPVLDTMLDKHGYPAPVARLLAETAVTGAALAAMLKYEGRFTLQAKGDGPVRLLVADMTHAGGLRAYARYDAAAVAAMGDEGIGLLGKGHLAFTVEPSGEGQETYQGIVPLRGANMAAAAQYYFRQSEQIPTGLLAAVAQEPDGAWRAACLMLQQMPDAGGQGATADGMTPQEFWQHVMVLMSSCTPEELLDPALLPADLLYRLFHGEQVRATPAMPLSHFCACATRIRDALRLFSREEVQDMAQDGVVTMHCEFCNSAYRFDEAAIAEIFAGR